MPVRSGGRWAELRCGADERDEDCAGLAGAALRGSDLAAGFAAGLGAGLGAGALTAGFFLGAPAPMVGGSETRGGRFSAAPPAERRRVEVFFLPPLAEEEEEEESEVVRLGRGREVIRVLRDLRGAGGLCLPPGTPGRRCEPGANGPCVGVLIVVAAPGRYNSDRQGRISACGRPVGDSYSWSIRADQQA